MRELAALLCLALAACASTGGTIDTLMKDYDGNVPGASVLVVRNGEAIVRKSYGFADLEARWRGHFSAAVTAPEAFQRPSGSPLSVKAAQWRGSG